MSHYFKYTSGSLFCRYFSSNKQTARRHLHIMLLLLLLPLLLLPPPPPPPPPPRTKTEDECNVFANNKPQPWIETTTNNLCAHTLPDAAAASAILLPPATHGVRHILLSGDREPGPGASLRIIFTWTNCIVTAWAVCQGHAVDRGTAPHLDARWSEGQVAALPAARNPNPKRIAYSFSAATSDGRSTTVPSTQL
jgi:hypothetical protein